MDNASDNAVELIQQELARAQAELTRTQNERDALRQEFQSESTFEEVIAVAKREFKDSIAPDAINQIKFLINNAESESVRASLSKWTLDLILSNKIEGNPDDTFGKLLKGLTKSDAEVS